MMYPIRKDHSKSAFAFGLGMGAALTAAGFYAWKKFKETHPDFSIKDYCEKCGILSDECDISCDDDCESCLKNQPSYEEDETDIENNIDDIEIDMTTEDEEESDDEEDGGRNLIGESIISQNTATNKALKIAKEIYGSDVSLKSEGSGKNVLITKDGKTRNCYMFWIESKGDDLTPIAVFYVDVMTGEVFDNSEKDMRKLSD